MKKSFTLIVMLLAVFALCGTAKAEYTYAVFDPSNGTLYLKRNADGNSVLSEDATVASKYIFKVGDDGNDGYRKNYGTSIKKIIVDKTMSGKTNFTSIKSLFKELSNLEEIQGLNNISLGNNSGVTSLYRLFYNCPNLKVIDGIEQWNTKNITDMDEMFYNCKSLITLNLSNFNTNKVTDMGEMFYNCQSLQWLDISSFNTAEVSDMGQMFYNCTSLENIFVGGNWKTTKASGKEMFYNCTALKGTPKGIQYKQSNPTDITYATTSRYLSSLSETNEAYARIENRTLFFRHDKRKTWLTSYNFENTGTGDPKWNTSSSRLYINKVVFDGCSSVYPTSTANWFNGMKNLTEITGTAPKFSKATTAKAMFKDCSSLVKTDFYMDLSKATDLSEMYYGCTNLASFPSIALSAVTNMNHMFYGCSSLVNAEFRTYDFSTSSCTDMSFMFANCSNIKIINLGALTTSNVTNTESMFANCSMLESIYVQDVYHDFDLQKVTNSQNMFLGCNNLKGGKKTGFSSSFINKTYARIDQGSTKKGYLSPYSGAITYVNTDLTTPKIYYSGAQVKINNVTKPGYIFQGWTCSGGYTISTPTQNLTIPALTAAYPIVLTANWSVDLSKNNYVKICFKSNETTSITYNNIDYKIGVLFDGKWLTEGTDYTINTSSAKDYGTYEIIITGIQSRGYTGSKTTKLYVKQAILTIQPDGKTKIYGDPDPTFTYTATGLRGKDQVTSIKMVRNLSVDAVGTIRIMVDDFAVDNQNNYYIKKPDGYLSIEPKPITITPKAASKTYGDPDPELEYIANGMLTDDILSGKLTRMPGENVGTYDIINNLSNKNYIITLASSAKFTINPKTVNSPTILFNSEVYVYNGTAVTPQITVLDGTTPIPASEYNVAVSNNNATGTGMVTITDNTGGNYTVSGQAYFTILDPSEAWKVTVKSSGMGDQIVERDVYVVKGQQLTADLLQIEGYTLQGVYTNEGHTSTYTLGNVLTSNLEIYAQYQINKHVLTINVDGKVVSTQNYNYGETITYPDMTKDGYTFLGWNTEPTTMPDANLTISGSYTINSYKLEYKLDGKLYHSETLQYNSSVTMQSTPPSKTGYKFSGWSNTLSYMPAHDVEITGSYIPNPHKVTFITSDESFIVETAYGVSIASIAPAKDGYRFVPEKESPTTVPDKDIEIHGTFEVRTYTLQYLVDYKEYKTEELYLGDPINIIAAPTKTGYTFSGWSEAPATMPAKDVTIRGSFKANEHTITYMVDGEVYKTTKTTFGSKIFPPTTPFKAGLKFSGWSNLPETMPDNDLTITGTFSSSTPVAEITESEDIKVWSYNRTIYIETAPDTKYTIIDLNGRILTTSTTKSSHNEISIAKQGIMIVIINNKSFKVSL